MKAIICAGATAQPGWLSLTEADLDVRDPQQWAEQFAVDSPKAVLAEHGWEHLHPEEAALATRNVYRHLRPGGVFRCATPDGFHPDERYISHVAPGIGFNGDDHKWLPNYRSLSQMLADAGFKVRLCEWWSEDGTFHRNEWRNDFENGVITRCPPGLYCFLHSVLVGTDYTSLIVDGFKL
jgi:predicted SAM-dependent methyltransferase